MIYHEGMSLAECVMYIQEKLPQSVILMQLAEECAETAKAALKLARIYQGVNPTPITADDAMAALIEELADITVCVGCIGGIDFDAVENVQDSKIERWAKRLAKGCEK